MGKIISTDRELCALKPGPSRYERAVSKARGLSVVVHPNGNKTFAVRYVSDAGARRRLLIGEYPGLSLADARLKAQVLRADVVGGRDPAAERAIARAEARMGETLEELGEHYFKAAAVGLHGGRRRPLRPGTIERQEALWRRHLKPLLAKRRFKDIRRADVRQVMQGFVLRGGLSAASIASIGDVLRAFYAYALHEDLVEANPAIGLTRPIIPEPRSRLFTDDALRQLLISLAEASASSAIEGRDDPHARMGAHMALGLRFVLLTLTRRTEAAGALWSEMDFPNRTWTIPGERTKNRRPHVVPLSPQTLVVLSEARALPNATEAGFVFPSPTVPSAHLDPRAMTRAVNRLCIRLGLPLGSPHDFRRTGATTLTGERYRVRRFIVGKVLNHSVNDGSAVTAVYDRNEYLADKREALEAWGRHLDGLLQPDQGDAPQRRVGHLRLVSSM